MKNGSNKNSQDDTNVDEYNTVDADVNDAIKEIIKIERRYIYGEDKTGRKKDIKKIITEYHKRAN